MRQLHALLLGSAGFLAGGRDDRDVSDELEAHLEMETAEYIRRGLPPEEARGSNGGPPGRSTS